MSELRFDGRVVIVTGAGGGLGRSHALLFASRGAKVVVNDLGGGMHGGGQSQRAADKVVDEIKAAGGEAVANYDSVENGAKIVQTALDHFKRLDVVINNAGILRDTSFQKMSEEDWELIYRVHVLGAFRVTHAAWPHLRDAGYGRIIFTASSAGIYGNFGQANYSMAKLGLVGLANTLAIEGQKKNVLVNTIAPVAGSRLTETVMPKELVDALKPEFVSPLVAYLGHESCDANGGLFEVGGGMVTRLRWERTQGKCFRLGRALTPEMVRDAWPQVCDFEKTDHPADITSSLQPILENVNAPPTKGGNEHIDVDAALTATLPPLTSKYDPRDLALYALGVGAAQNPLDPKELSYVFELSNDGFLGLPTYGVVPAVSAILNRFAEGATVPGLNFSLDRILHGEQYTELRRPLPPKANLRHKGRIKDVFDKGKHALVVFAVSTEDADTGEELVYNEITLFVRGAGGWGGDRGPSTDIPAPDRKPDAVLTEKTSDNQALLYRLSGDWNPLHADPSFAEAFGFPKPILHGLCTFGYAGRHVVKSFSNNDGRYFKSIKVRFADSVFPGETLQTQMWRESPTRILFRTKALERDKVVLSNGAIELYAEIPTPKAAPAASASAPAAAAPASAEPISNDVFAGIGAYLEKNPELAAKVGAVFVFNLTNPASAWTVDLKNGKGGVSEGAAPKADTTLTLSNADFMDMVGGKADPQKLFLGGKLKISGNVMASQKLEFLRKIDPELVLQFTRKRAGGAPAQASPAAAPTGASGPSTADVFEAISGYVGEHPELAQKVNGVFLFKIQNPESTWTLELKGAKGNVSAGATTKPDTTLQLSDADFMDMVMGKADPQKLFLGGKLKISGNVMLSQKLEFLGKLDRSRIKVGAAQQASAGAAASGAAPAQAEAKAVFAGLTERLKKNPNLVKEVGAVLQFKVTSPDSAWVVDLKSGAGSVREGTLDKATTVITLSDEDLGLLSKGQSTPQALFMQGKLRVDGEMGPAQRLAFIKQ